VIKAKQKDEYLSKRKIICNYIIKHPGLHFSELSRMLKIPKSTIKYHLMHLKKKGYVVTRCDGRYIRYYANGLLAEFDKNIIDLIRQEVPSKIIFYLFSHPDSSLRQISSNLDKHPSTISFHLKKLIDFDILAFNPISSKIHYSLKYPKHISNLIDKYIIDNL
jgi:predicted transcriptional regulator